MLDSYSLGIPSATETTIYTLPGDYSAFTITIPAGIWQAAGPSRRDGSKPLTVTLFSLPANLPSGNPPGTWEVCGLAMDLSPLEAKLKDPILVTMPCTAAAEAAAVYALSSESKWNKDVPWAPVRAGTVGAQLLSLGIHVPFALTAAGLPLNTTGGHTPSPANTDSDQTTLIASLVSGTVVIGGLLAFAVHRRSPSTPPSCFPFFLSLSLSEGVEAIALSPPKTHNTQKGFRPIWADGDPSPVSAPRVH